MSAIKHKLKQTIDNQNKQAQANIEAEQKARSEEAKARMDYQNSLLQLEYDKLDRDDLNKQLDRELDIQLEEIKAYAFDEGPNPVDISNAANQALKQQEINLKHLNEQSKLSEIQRQRDQDRMLKEKELQLKKDIEDKKIKAIEVQNKSQELINKENVKIKEKELIAKEKIEKLKLLAAKAKASKIKK
jgi:hypothetical protein